MFLLHHRIMSIPLTTSSLKDKIIYLLYNAIWQLIAGRLITYNNFSFNIDNLKSVYVKINYLTTPKATESDLSPI